MPAMDEVVGVARALGIRLSRREAYAYSKHLDSVLKSTEDFMSQRFDDEAPPLLEPIRAPGHPPSAADDPFNAWLWKCEIRGGTPDGLLAGKTASFKDNIAVAGIPLTLGSYLMEGYTPDFDATVVNRVLKAGATVVGKNSMNGPTSGWGWGIPGDYKRPLNPANPAHWAGGSSSGSAVAVAAGEVDISFGGDQGGSIRIPAAYCGIYGLKPTFGLVSHFGIGFGSDQSVDHTGPMTTDAEVLAAALDAVAGYDSYDPRQDRTVPASIDTLQSLKDGVRGIRIGVLDEGFVGADSGVRDAVMAAVDVLVAAGAQATRVSVPEHQSAGAALDALALEGSRAIFDVGFLGAFARTYYPAAFMEATYKLYHEHTDRLTAMRKLALIASEFTRKRFHGTVYAKAQNARTAFRKAFDSVLDRVDVLAMPTSLEVAPLYVAPSSDSPIAFDLRTPSGTPVNACTKAYNFTGHPALTVPCGRSGGLPVGMQLVSRFYAEPLLLRTAYAFQHSVDWKELTGVPALGDKTARQSTGRESSANPD